MKSLKRSDGPAGPTGSYDVSSAGPAGPVGPEWLKYGPIERITGVFWVGAIPFGRRMSACSVTPPDDGKVASLQSAPSGTGAADAVAGRAAASRASRAKRHGRDRIPPVTPVRPRSCAPVRGSQVLGANPAHLRPPG